MDHPNKNIVAYEEEEKEEVLFNSDTLSKIISFLPSFDLLNLALTCTRLGISDNDDSSSLIEKSARIATQDIATEEQLAALPYYEGESSLADYHYLQLLRQPLTFDQLVGDIDYVGEYVNSEDKSCVTSKYWGWVTAFSNSIMRAGKHYVTFEARSSAGLGINLSVGVMRPGQANQLTSETPTTRQFYQHFTRSDMVSGVGQNNKVQCCMIHHNGNRCLSDWGDNFAEIGGTWDGMESFTYGDEIGMLLDLDDGTLSVYKNGRKLGVMKSGLAGQYCWVAALFRGVDVTIKRGTVPLS